MGRSPRRAAALLIAAALMLGLTGCGGVKNTVTYYTYFDTVTTITYYGSDREFTALCAAAEEMMDRYNRACDIYHEYSGGGNACTLNRMAGKGPVAVMPELIEVLAFGQEMHELTGGMCNIAMGAVFSLWHDCREAALAGGRPTLPTDVALLEAARHCRIDDIRLDRLNGTAELADPDMRVDLGAVAKGYAAERVAMALEEAGFDHVALNLGGNVRTIGEKSRNTDWVAGIQDPDQAAESAYLLRVSLSDASLVTSGSYQRFYEVGGVRYHHIISPKTLYPDNTFVSVTIRAHDSGVADALSTALFNMSFEDGFNFINRTDGVEACWIDSYGSVRFSQGFRQYVLD